jgi:hypothetical protein
MGYNPTKQIISQPVSVYDVQQCCWVRLQRTVSGQTQTRYSGDVGVLCCAQVGDTIPASDGLGSWTVIARGTVNMWSPRKPIYSPKVVQLTNQDWQGGAHTDPNYKTGGGIKKAIVTGTAFLNSSGSGGALPSAIWTHDKPILDGICAFRLTDFAGYWHTIGRMFYIGTIFGNISNIIIPTSDSDDGANLGFSMWFNVNTGQITAHELFGDCWDTFYPGVIMCCGGDYKFNYVKTTNSPISSYASSTANISFNTRDFMDQMKADWIAKGLSGSPYGRYPFRKGDNWTACLVLISREFTGGDGSNHKLSGSESIVRLEYAAPTNGVYVDRRTLPMKPSKYNTIDWIKMKVYLTRVGIDNGYEVYKLEKVDITANMLSANSITLTVGVYGDNKSYVQTPGGYVNVTGVGQDATVYLTNFFQVTFSGTVGEVTKTFIGGTNFAETKYYVSQSATIGNKLCNGQFVLYYSNLGSFIGVWSIDITSQSYQYTSETELQ